RLGPRPFLFGDGLGRTRGRALELLQVRRHISGLRICARLERLRSPIRRISSAAGGNRSAPLGGREMARASKWNALWVCAAFAAASFACQRTKGPPGDSTPTFSLNGVQSADDPGSCATCHPRQFREWAGSSHNYGQALDPGYQSLEITGNYLAHFRFGRPVFRQNFLCITCHAPSVGGYEKGKDGLYRLNPNAQFRAAPPPDQPVGRELRRPDNAESVLEPPGRAAEFIADPNMGQMQIDDPMLSMGDLIKRRRISFQGITCETCHKTGRPFDDLEDDDP